MSQFIAKIKLILFPYLIISAATIAFYTFLHWLLFIKFYVVNVNYEIVQLIMPMVVPWLPILIWLTPRFRLLDLRTKKGDPLWTYQGIMWVAIGAPLVFAQFYITTATGKLTTLDNINQIQSKPASKYYSLKRYYIDKLLVNVKPVFEVSGKHDENFNIIIYAPCPIFDSNSLESTLQSGDTVATIKPGKVKLKGIKGNPILIIDGKLKPLDTLALVNPYSIESTNVLKGAAAVAIYGNAAKNGAIILHTKGGAVGDPPLQLSANAGLKPAAWLGVKYKKTISNKLSGNEKQQVYEDFARETEQEFGAAAFEFEYLERIEHTDDSKNFNTAILEKGRPHQEPLIILSPVNESFAARNGSKLIWLLGSYAGGSLLILIALQFKPLLRKAPIKRKAKSRRYWLAHTKKWLIPAEGFFTTHIIISANIIVFIIMVCSGLGFISFSADDLLKWGGNYRPAVLNGQYWRLLTSTFLHGGIMHLLFNMYGLLFVGIFLESVLGRVKFVILYIVTGILASLASIWWHPATVGVGASGAIFGMYGVFLAILTTNYFEPAFKKSFLITTSVFVGYNLLYGLIGNIDNAAHIGGLISGVIAGYIIYFTVLKGIVKKEEL